MSRCSKSLQSKSSSSGSSWVPCTLLSSSSSGSDWLTASKDGVDGLVELGVSPRRRPLGVVDWDPGVEAIRVATGSTNGGGVGSRSGGSDAEYVGILCGLWGRHP